MKIIAALAVGLLLTTTDPRRAISAEDDPARFVFVTFVQTDENCREAWISWIDVQFHVANPAEKTSP